MAVNGRVLAGHGQLDRKFNPGREPDAVSGLKKEFYFIRNYLVLFEIQFIIFFKFLIFSVCSCTCYGSTTKDQHRRMSTAGGGLKLRPRNYKPWYSKFWQQLFRKLGCQDFSGRNSDDGNYYDEETQSISNHARFAIKRASL